MFDFGKYFSYSIPKLMYKARTPIILKTDFNSRDIFITNKKLNDVHEFYKTTKNVDSFLVALSLIITGF